MLNLMGVGARLGPDQKGAATKNKPNTQQTINRMNYRTASGGDHVLGEVVEELLDVVIVQFLKLEAGPDDTLVEVEGFVIEAAANGLENFESGSGALLLQALLQLLENTQYLGKNGVLITSRKAGLDK